MTKQDLIREINDWLIVALKVGALGIMLVYIKRILRAVKEIFFGKEGYDYREFIGAVAAGGFIGMLWKHFTDNKYEPDLYLLGACLVVIFVLAGIKEGVAILNKFIGAKYENGNNDKADPKV